MQGGKCVYTFDKADFKGYRNSSSSSGSTNGFTITYTSEQTCTDDASKNYVFTIDAVCAKDHSEDPIVYGTCTAYLKDSGPDNCKLPINLGAFYDFVNKLAPFLGIILILVGIIMTFAGAKFLLLVITALTFIAVTGLVFLVFYNLFLGSNSSQGVMVTVLVIALIAGGAASYLG